MPRNLVHTTKTPKKKNRKQPEIPLKSITKKLEKKELGRSLTRRKHQNKSTSNFDEAVPFHLKKQLFLTTTSQKLTIQRGFHLQSPFVLNLKQEVPQPETLIEQTPLIQLNLLHPRLQNPMEQPQNLEHILTVHSHDLCAQLQEDAQTIATFTQTKTTNSQSNSPTLPKKSFSLPNQSLFSLDHFLPKQIPKNLLAYFDFPETEPDEIEESDLVELDETHTISPSPASNPLPKFLHLPQLLFFRPIATFVAISFAFVLPLHAMNVVSGLKQTKSKVEAASNEAFSFLRSGTNAATTKQPTEIASEFQKAQTQFSKAQSSVAEMGIGTSLLISAIPKAKNLLSAGEHISIAAASLGEAMTMMATQTNTTPVSRILLLQSYLRPALPHLLQANTLVQQTNAKQIPKRYKETLTDIQSRLPLMIESLSEFDTLSDLAINILGSESTKRYLLIFQNNTELRATGGFMGSFAELSVHNGVMEQLSVPGGGTYDLQGSLQQGRIAPKPLQLLTAKWEFQDANWFADFPTSARQIIELYRDAGGPSVDGVIAINATYVADLIGLLGPIDMPNYDRTIDQENFLFEAQKIVELEYDREKNKPKQFIGDLASELVSHTLKDDPEQFLALIDRLSQGLQQKDVQLYFTDQQIQQKMLARHWGGAVEHTSGDYLMVVNTNLGGGKTDGVIEENIDVAIQIEEDGSMINTVTIKRTHHGISGMVFTGVNNVNYLRLFVPKGSELISASGFRIPDNSLFEYPKEEWIFDDDLQYAAITSQIHKASQTEVYEEHGKTVFGNWIQTAPGETSTIQFTYRLPFKLFDMNPSLTDQIKTAVGIEKTDAYSLMIQKQSGMINRETSVKIHIPKSMKPIWQSVDQANLNFQNSTDNFFALLLKRS